MTAKVEVNSKSEGEAIKTALDDPTVRAIAIVLGVLKPLSEKARGRVLAYIRDQLDEWGEAN